MTSLKMKNFQPYDYYYIFDNIYFEKTSKSL